VILFRVVYYLIPFGVAALLFLINEYSPVDKATDAADGI
jgi:uncharacterized membrane protein YbhN (UPF0104 family)